jgi:hypothetical protein
MVLQTRIADPARRLGVIKEKHRHQCMYEIYMVRLTSAVYVRDCFKQEVSRNRVARISVATYWRSGHIMMC